MERNIQRSAPQEIRITREPATGGERVDNRQQDLNDKLSVGNAGQKFRFGEGGFRFNPGGGNRKFRFGNGGGRFC